jgi:DeoR/GlpR family transcriptional regulator of sugar metabolism
MEFFRSTNVSAWPTNLAFDPRNRPTEIMFAPERHNEIRKIIRKHRRMDFLDLQRLVKVSPATLRRDLTELEDRGEIIRVHGGVLDPGYVRAEISFDERILRNGAAKKAISLTAAALIPEGVTVFVDAGSTCLEAGKALLGRRDLRIITHSVPLIEAGRRGEAEILCVGGTLRKVSGAMTGAAALGTLERLRADWALVGASGLDPAEGCLTTELSEAEIKRSFLTRANRKVLLADSSKWGQMSTIRFASWTDLSDWVTERAPAEKESRELRARGLKIRIAE